MDRKEILSNRKGLLISVVLLALLSAAASPFLFHSKAVNAKPGIRSLPKTESHDPGIPNYDIRQDTKAGETLASFRAQAGLAASDVADAGDNIVKAEESLRAKVPTLKVDYNLSTRTPEVIAPDVLKSPSFLTGPSSRERVDTLRGFLRQNSDLIAVSESEVDRLKVSADYTNPDGVLSFAALEQEINGIPVFQGEIKAGFTKRGEIIRVINNLAAGVDASNVSTEFGDPSEAVKAASLFINREPKAEELVRNADTSDKLKIVFGTGDWATTAEKMYFPTEPGVAVPAWRILIWQPVSSYYVIVDAAGKLLWRKNITEDQSQTSIYQVYANPSAMINVADSPSPLTPGIIDPSLGTQAPLLTRTNIGRLGNESPYTFNNNGWINDGGNTTDGNAVESGLDLDSTDGVDAGTLASGSPFRVFNSNWNPPPGNPAPGDPPSNGNSQRGAVIQQFWIMNWYHDELYRLGFTEAARNFQTDNFSRGGLGADRISAQGQDFTGVNNANFSTAADGVRGKMQMYVWNGADPDRDGTTDAEIMIHEATHGTSNRLHGNGSGLSTNMSRGMGEGWGDFYAHSLLSEPSDPVGGIYTIGGYALYQGYAGTIGTKNYYYGIRRFPKAIISSVGANGKPHNPLTFADIDSTQLNTSDGAFAQMTGPHISGTADQVHAAGEIWSSALWEVRARLVQRLGWSDGNRRALQLVTDGMKLAPIGPDFLQERDAIIAAALGSSPSAAQIADVTDVWAGFAARGMGFGASIQSTGSGVGDARVSEAFDVPGLIQAPKLTISDSLGDNDGIFEPGENLRLTVPLSNVSGVTASNVFVQITGGGSAAYGAVSAAGTASQIITFKIPNAIACGAQINLIFTVSSSLGNSFFTVPIAVGAPNITYFESFDGVNAPAFPGGWTATSISGGVNFVTSTNGADTPPNAAFALDPQTVGGGTDLTSPSILISAQAATVSFRNFYDTEPGFDGGVLEISIGAGPFQDIVSAGGSFVQNGYNGLIHPSSANNPLAGKLGWTGNSKTYLTTVARLPTNASGQLVRFRWRFGADTNTGVTGWKVDQLQVAGSFLCSFTPVNTIKSRADFDFDGKTDLSVWRPSDGNWYVFRSGGGITAVAWGIATDTPVPGDFDGDSKADMTVFRPTDTPFATFYTLNSNGFTVTSTTFGIAGDTPLTGDFDGDSKTDVAVFRSSTNTWYIKGSNGGGGYSTTLFGEAGDIPVPADYNGDTKTDIAVWRPSTGQWFVINSGAGFTATAWGALGDRPVPADYNGDDKDDLAVYRPSDGKWYLFMNGTTIQTIPWGGTAGDIPVPGDYDGDGKDDAAIYRGGTWYVLQSGGGITGTNWGVASDIPILSKYVP